MSDSCPLPIDWLDYLEGEMPERLTAHLRDCPSCSEVVSLQRQQPGSVQDQGWFERFRYMDGGRLVEEAVASPGVAELWLSAGSWRFHDTEYKPPERSLVLVLSDAISHESEEPSWFDVAPVRTDVEVALPTDFLVTADESSYGCPLRVVLSMECKVERRQLESRVGSLADVDIVISALGERNAEWRWGNPLEGPEDPRLSWETSFLETLDALRGPWLQFLDGIGREQASDPLTDDAELGDLLFFPVEWQAHGPEPALAAAASGHEKVRRWQLKTNNFRIDGSFSVDWDAGSLVFSIDHFWAPDTIRLRLHVYLKGEDEPRTSEVFQPVEGYRVLWPEPRVPDEVEKLGAKVV